MCGHVAFARVVGTQISAGILKWHTRGTQGELVVYVHTKKHFIIWWIAGAPGSTPAASTEAPHDLAVVGGFVVGAVSEADTRLSAQVVPATDRRLPQEQVKAEPG